MYLKEINALKKIFLLLMVASVLSLACFAQPIYSFETTENISDSITLTRVESFYSDYNMSYSYITADLTDNNFKFTLFKSDEGIDVLDTVLNLANDEKGAVAAVNADFFSWYKGKSGFSLGIEIKDGALLQSPINPDTMATVFYDGNEAVMEYLQFNLMVVAPNYEYAPVRHVNKHTEYYGDILMYTSGFNGGMSPAPGGNVVEVVVSDGELVEFRRNMPPCEIPEDGCVLVVSEGSSMFFANNFNEGDEIHFDYYYTPDFSEVETAFGGGAFLVREGETVKEYSHIVSGTHPRSAVGVSRDGKTMYLVAVDGRQKSSKGMTMNEMASLMLSLGCYNAVNLDGGGSTQMVASTPWLDSLHIVNSPSENRKVMNAVGFTYVRDEDDIEPFDILIMPDKTEVFIGQEVNISAIVVDESLRPIDADEIELYSDFGDVDDGVFIPEQSGVVTVTAEYDDIVKECSLYVVDRVRGIEVKNDKIKLEKGDREELVVSVFDEFGHYVSIQNFEDFEITSSDVSVVSVLGNTIIARNEGTALVSIRKDNAESIVSVSVGGTVSEYTDDFEENRGYFSSYPEDTRGYFELSDSMFFDGKMSGKLFFDFEKDEKADEESEDKTSDETSEGNDAAEEEKEEEDVSRAVYYSLDEKITLDENCDEITLYAYSDKEIGHALKVQFVDGNGRIETAEFQEYSDVGEWQKLSAKIPEDAVRPLVLDRIYVLYVPEEEKDSGEVYLDNLSFSRYDAFDFPERQSNTYDLKKNTQKVSGCFRIGAVPKTTDNPISFFYKRMTESYVAYADFGVTIGGDEGFVTYSDDNALYLKVDTSDGGIKKTDSSQWNYLKSEIDGFDGKNVFVLCECDIFGDDEFENRVIHAYLDSLDKNVFVITPSDSTTYKKIDSVNYFTLDNSPASGVNVNRKNVNNCIEFTFGDETCFAFESVR